MLIITVTVEQFQHLMLLTRNNQICISHSSLSVPMNTQFYRRQKTPDISLMDQHLSVLSFYKNILTKGMFVPQLPSNVGISV